MLTVCFLLLASVLLQGGFMRASEMFGRYTHTLQGMAFLERQRAAAQEALYLDGDTGTQSGVLSLQGKKALWSRSMQPAGTNLYDVHTVLRWEEGGRPFELHGESYAYKKDLSQA